MVYWKLFSYPYRYFFRKIENHYHLLLFIYCFLIYIQHNILIDIWVALSVQNSEPNNKFLKIQAELRRANLTCSVIK